MEDNVSAVPNKILLVFLLLIFINLIAIDLWIVRTINPPASGSTKNNPLSPSVSSTSKPTQQTICPLGCNEVIKEATASLAIVNKASVKEKIIPRSSLAKEFFVPLGAGSSTAEEWTDVAGAQAVIDISNYGHTKQVIFEVSLHIPTGNEYAYVRLFNANDNLPVSASELYYPGSSDQLFLTSKPLALSAGSKVYKVQMKTQLKYEAILDQSRLHIITY